MTWSAFFGNGPFRERWGTDIVDNRPVLLYIWEYIISPPAGSYAITHTLCEIQTRDRRTKRFMYRRRVNSRATDHRQRGWQRERCNGTYAVVAQGAVQTGNAQEAQAVCVHAPRGQNSNRRWIIIAPFFIISRRVVLISRPYPARQQSAADSQPDQLLGHKCVAAAITQY